MKSKSTKNSPRTRIRPKKKSEAEQKASLHIIIGPALTGIHLANEIRAKYKQDRVIPFDPYLKNPEEYGEESLLTLDDIPLWIEKFKTGSIYFALPRHDPLLYRNVMEKSAGSKFSLLLLDPYSRKQRGKHALHKQLRKMNLEDLLCRNRLPLDEDEVEQLIHSGTVLITGAGGSIGSELCRQVLKYNPKKILLIDNSEYFLYELNREMERMLEEKSRHSSYKKSNTKLVPIIADIKNREHISVIMNKYHPDLVLHAAAYKHVPMMEFNSLEAVRNNVGGTLVLAQEAAHAGVERFVLISTDKAVNPTSVMGATKRICEMVCQQQMSDAKVKTRFIAVRFGNVIGSTGSVVPLFQEQLAAGGPLTVTHPDIERYFMSIPEAALLVLQAAARGEGGEVFVLDMGKPVRVCDIARSMILLSGLVPEKDIAIEYTGLRAGEKLFEELLTDQERTIPTTHPDLHIARLSDLPDTFAEKLAFLLNLNYRSDEKFVRSAIRAIVPEYSVPQNKDQSIKKDSLQMKSNL